MTIFKGHQLSAAAVGHIYAIEVRISLTVLVFTIESLTLKANPGKFIQKFPKFSFSGTQEPEPGCQTV